MKLANLFQPGKFNPHPVRFGFSWIGCSLPEIFSFQPAIPSVGFDCGWGCHRESNGTGHPPGKWKIRGQLVREVRDCQQPDELEKIKKDISKVGFYPIVLDKDEAEELEKQPEKMAARFEMEMCQRVREWMALAEENWGPGTQPCFSWLGTMICIPLTMLLPNIKRSENPDMSGLRSKVVMKLSASRMPI